VIQKVNVFFQERNLSSELNLVVKVSYTLQLKLPVKVKAIKSKEIEIIGTK